MSKSDFTDAERHKMCIKCQACCKKLSFRMPPLGNVIAFYQARGLSITRVSISEVWVDVPHTCPQLTKEGCKLYHTNLPFACQEFDGDTHPTTHNECLWNKEARHAKR